MTHLRSRGLKPETETEVSKTKIAWRENRLVGAKDVLELFARVEVKRMPRASGDRFKRIRSADRKGRERGDTKES